MKLMMEEAEIIGTIEPEKELSVAIGDHAVIASTLVDRMYSDLVRIVLQEYACNARDAHREAGIADTPIDVHLPCAAAPELRIRDYGLGISPDRMERVFVLLGTSTKRGDNTQTGGFGIGAKCGFAYNTKSFTITTYSGGMLYIYSCYRAGTGKFRIDLIAESPNDTERGTEIAIPVSDKDIVHFSTQAIKLFLTWTPRPNLHNLQKDLQFPVILVNNDKLLVLRTPKVPKNTVFIDDIPYEVKAYNGVHGTATLGLFTCYSKFAGGELVVSANRESIEESAEVIERLAEAAAERLSQATPYMLAVVESTPSPLTKHFAADPLLQFLLNTKGPLTDQLDALLADPKLEFFIPARDLVRLTRKALADRLHLASDVVVVSADSPIRDICNFYKRARKKPPLCIRVKYGAEDLPAGFGRFFPTEVVTIRTQPKRVTTTAGTKRVHLPAFDGRLDKLSGCCGDAETLSTMQYILCNPGRKVDNVSVKTSWADTPVVLPVPRRMVSLSLLIPGASVVLLRPSQKKLMALCAGEYVASDTIRTALLQAAAVRHLMGDTVAWDSPLFHALVGDKLPTGLIALLSTLMSVDIPQTLRRLQVCDAMEDTVSACPRWLVHKVQSAVDTCNKLARMNNRVFRSGLFHAFSYNDPQDLALLRTMLKPVLKGL
jgi:hypothetical protein